MAKFFGQRALSHESVQPFRVPATIRDVVVVVELNAGQWARWSLASKSMHWLTGDLGYGGQQSGVLAECNSGPERVRLMQRVVGRGARTAAIVGRSRRSANHEPAGSVAALDDGVYCTHEASPAKPLFWFLLFVPDKTAGPCWADPGTVTFRIRDVDHYIKPY